MPQTPVANFQQVTERLLGHLRHEELLLQTSKETLLGVHHALRKGDLGALHAAQPHQEKLARDLHEASARRGLAAEDLAAALGLPPAGLSLTDFADRLPPTLGKQLRDVRDRLRDVVAEVVELQRANANLVQTLRSYFRGVLSGLTSAETPSPTRYGPTGGRLQPVG